MAHAHIWVLWARPCGCNDRKMQGCLQPPGWAAGAGSRPGAEKAPVASDQLVSLDHLPAPRTQVAVGINSPTASAPCPERCQGRRMPAPPHQAGPPTGFGQTSPQSLPRDIFRDVFKARGQSPLATFCSHPRPYSVPSSDSIKCSERGFIMRPHLTVRSRRLQRGLLIPWHLVQGLGTPP